MQHFTKHDSFPITKGLFGSVTPTPKPDATCMTELQLKSTIPGTYKRNYQLLPNLHLIFPIPNEKKKKKKIANFKIDVQPQF